MMDLTGLRAAVWRAGPFLLDRLTAEATWLQVLMIGAALLLARILIGRLQKRASPGGTIQHALERLHTLVYPVCCTLLLLLASAASQLLLGRDGVLRIALMISLLWLFECVIRLAVPGPLASRALRWVGMPIIALKVLGFLSPLASALDSMSVEVGNLHLTVSGLFRVLVFGSLLFWLGWISNTTGQDIIRRQESLDVRTRELLAKIFQIGLAVLMFLLFLNIMGINLTALAVFGGALGVGLGFGLQSIASNLISGIIILFDRSLSVGDYVELESGQTGYVRELTLRYTTLETFEGKAVLVPNETFISSPFVNWTHKHRKQRYRVDFSVGYKTDVRALCEMIREVVASHPQVLSGEAVPFEERPDCEIDSFGDNGVNMFVEFWMEGVDDGRNRVGGDLLLMILEALQHNGIEIPYPQREVRMLQ